MNNQNNDNKAERLAADQQPESNPLMACYNALPPEPERPARFYWQEPWRDAADDAVQAAFEN